MLRVDDLLPGGEGQEIMPSHFSSIGFPVASEADFTALARQAVEGSPVLPAPGGGYCCWAPGRGVELWVALQRRGLRRRLSLAGAAPHFSGPARLRVAIERCTATPGYPMEGALHCWANPSDDEPPAGDYPFVCEAVGFRLIQPPGRRCLRRATLQLAVFAHSLDLYDSDQAFDRAPTRPGNLQLAAEAFIPTGMITTAGQPADQYRAEALLTGHILAAEEVANPVTGLPFHHLHLRTLGGEVDVVADPELVAAPPQVGGVAQVTGWLSGRVVEEPPCEG